jgi:hypothetical protein
MVNSMEPDQAGLDLCWWQTHYVAFVMAQHNYNLLNERKFNTEFIEKVE